MKTTTRWTLMTTVSTLPPPNAQDADKATSESASEMELDPLGDYNEGPSKRKIYEVDYESLSQAEVEKQMQGDVDYITGLFGVTVSGLLSCHTICAHICYSRTSRLSCCGTAIGTRRS